MPSPTWQSNHHDYLSWSRSCVWGRGGRGKRLGECGDRRRGSCERPGGVARGAGLVDFWARRRGREGWRGQGGMRQGAARDFAILSVVLTCVQPRRGCCGCCSLTPTIRGAHHLLFKRFFSLLHVSRASHRATTPHLRASFPPPLLLRFFHALFSFSGAFFLFFPGVESVCMCIFLCLRVRLVAAWAAGPV